MFRPSTFLGGRDSSHVRPWSDHETREGDENGANHHPHIQPRSKNGGNTVSPTNSIENQFTILSNQKETFICERKSAEKELKQIQHEHNVKKANHGELTESNRHAKKSLGERMKTLAIMKEEEARIIRLTENEFQAIQECANHSKSLDRKQIETLRKYRSEMDSLNDELAVLLAERLQEKTDWCISIQSLEAVVLPEIHHSSTSVTRPQLWRERENVLASMEVLRSATHKYEDLLNRVGELYSNCDGINENLYQGIGADRSPDTAGLVMKSNKQHVDFFYGNEEFD